MNKKSKRAGLPIRTGLPKGHLETHFKLILQNADLLGVPYSEILSRSSSTMYSNGDGSYSMSPRGNGHSEAVIEFAKKRPHDLPKQVGLYDPRRSYSERRRLHIGVGGRDYFADWLDFYQNGNGCADKSFRDLLKMHKMELLFDLGYRPTYIVFAAHENSSYTAENLLDRKSLDVYTELPYLVFRFLKLRLEDTPARFIIRDGIRPDIRDTGKIVELKKRKEINIYKTNGSTETYGIISASSKEKPNGPVVAEIAEKGNSLEDHHLVPIEVIYHSTPVMVVDEEIADNPIVSQIEKSIDGPLREARINHPEWFESRIFENKYPEVVAKYHKRIAGNDAVTSVTLSNMPAENTARVAYK